MQLTHFFLCLRSYYQSYYGCKKEEIKVTTTLKNIIFIPILISCGLRVKKIDDPPVLQAWEISPEAQQGIPKYLNCLV